MITSLGLKNFKAWEDAARVEFSGITAFFGGNSSGKTSLLQSLLLLKQTADSADRGRVFDLGGPASLVNLGTFRDLLFGHDESRRLAIDLTWQESTAFQIRSTERQDGPVVGQDKRLRMAVDVSATPKGPVVDCVEYGVGDMRFRLRRNPKGEYALESSNYKFIRVQGRAWPLPPPGKFYSFPDQVRAYYQNASFLSDLELKFEELCGRIFYLGPLRQDPERQYTWGGGRPADVGKRGELAVQALIASQLDGRTNSRGFARVTGTRRKLPYITVEQHVAAWLQELGLISSFSLKPLDERKTIYQVLVKRTAHSPAVPLTDVGFGISQVLPILVLLAYVPEGSTVLLEQPEIHLHPAVQSGLADVLIEAAKARNLQVVVESHSEHLLMRLQRRLAERELARGTVLDAEDCRLYFCEATSTRSVLSSLNLDLVGNITNWPDDFFGDAFGEAAAMTKAARRRVMGNHTA